MKVVRTVSEVREHLREPRRRGERIGLVPTMGALHAGHRSLLDAARAASDVVVMSLFVNPSQFDAADDLARYPRDESADAAMAVGAGVDLLFAPLADELFPPGFDTWVDPGALGEVLEGAARPGHFRGVATVCAKLFSIVGPHAAYFGEKDAQQVAIIRQIVRDLDLPLEIVAMPTIREPTGLALSSRNRFLSADEREVAQSLPRALAAGRDAHHAGSDVVEAARAVLDAEPGLSIDYVEVAGFGEPTLVAAIRVGATRLIDNTRLQPR